MCPRIQSGEKERSATRQLPQSASRSPFRLADYSRSGPYYLLIYLLIYGGHRRIITYLYTYLYGGHRRAPRQERPARRPRPAVGPLLPSARSLPRRPPPGPRLASARPLHPRRLRLAAKVRVAAGGGRSTERGRHRGAEVRGSVERPLPHARARRSLHPRRPRSAQLRRGSAAARRGRGQRMGPLLRPLGLHADHCADLAPGLRHARSLEQQRPSAGRDPCFAAFVSPSALATFTIPRKRITKSKWSWSLRSS